MGDRGKKLESGKLRRTNKYTYATIVAWGTPFPRSRMPAYFEFSMKLTVCLHHRRAWSDSPVVASYHGLRPVHVHGFRQQGHERYLYPRLHGRGRFAASRFGQRSAGSNALMRCIPRALARCAPCAPPPPRAHSKRRPAPEPLPPPSDQTPTGAPPLRPGGPGRPGSHNCLIYAALSHLAPTQRDPASPSGA